MKFLFFLGVLVIGYFSFQWAWLTLLVILAASAFVAWFQAYVWKRRILMYGYGYTKIPQLSDDANELYSAYPQFYGTPKAAQALVETSNLLWVAGLGLAVWGAFQQYWYGIGFFVAGFILALITSIYFKPRSNKTNLQVLHDEIMAYKLIMNAQRIATERTSKGN